jgi:hypothetical protein
MQVPIATRHKLAEVFGFKKVRSTHVSNDIVVDDGFNIKDIEDALTVEKMQDYTFSTETDMGILFGLTVDKAEGKLPPVIEPTPEATPIPIETISTNKHAKAKKRKQK